MPERRPIRPDLSTLGRILAPDSPEATTLKRSPDTGQKTVLMEAINLTLPEDFAMTDFDALVLNGLYQGATQNQVAEFVKSEFEKRKILVYLDKNTVGDYLDVLRGVGVWQDKSRPALSGNFPTIRARYNAMRMLEVGKFPDHKRYLQYITASMLSAGLLATKAAASLKITTPAVLVDMMMLDLLEAAPDELTKKIDECARQYSANYPRGAAFEDFLSDFKKGFVLKMPPRTTGFMFDRAVNQAVSSLWLEKLEQNPALFRAEDMQYIRNSLDIFVKGHNRDTTKSNRENAGMGLVNKWMKDTYLASTKNVGSAVVSIVMGLDYDGDDITEIIDRGLDHLQSINLL